LVIKAGSVVELGGAYEVQKCDTANSTKIAGVVTESSAMAMNVVLPDGKPRVLVAVAGRVDCNVYGTCSKGDLLVSMGSGYAVAATGTPAVGTVIGRAMEDKATAGAGTIEILLGRS
jgi:hypothetical protein